MTSIISTHVSHVDSRLSDNELRKDMLYSICEGYSGTRPTYFKYTDFSTTYHRSAQLAKKDLSFQMLVISKAIKEYKEVHKKYPSSAKNRDGERSSPGTAVHASGASK